MTGHFGHRGLWLLLLGLIWFAFGVGLFFQPETPAPGAFHQMLPTPLRAAMWMTAASVAIYTGLRGRGQDDSWGHIALWVMPAERMLSYSGSWALYLISALANHLFGANLALGYVNGWYPALIWVFIVTMLRLVAAWPNPSEVPHPPTNGADE
jgi:hypothetical protein